MAEPLELSDAREAFTRSPAREEPRSLMPWLLGVLGLLTLLLFVPYFAGQIAYRSQLGQHQALRELMDQPEFASLGKQYTLVAKSLNPSVVHIDTQRSGRRGNDELSVMFDGRGQQSQGQASGVIVDDSGYIVTNHHVIAGADRVFVNLSDQQKRYPAEVLGSDPKNDLAVLKINAPNLIAAPWGDSDLLEVGDIVFAMGNPFGLDGTLTQGIVSAKSRRWINERYPYQEYLQTDAAVNPGNSGGPLVNIQGQVIGINTAIVGPTFQGISFAIPSNVVKEIYDKIKATGKVSNGYLGVNYNVLNEEVARRLGLSEPRGALVANVRPDSPAAKAGIKQRDVIRKWNNTEIDDARLLAYLVARTPVGTKVPVMLIREGKELTLEVTVEERPAGLD